MPSRRQPPLPLDPREFRSQIEIETAVAKLRLRIKELEALDARAAVLNRTAADDVAESNVRETIRDVFGGNSPEFNQHKFIELWDGPRAFNMSSYMVAESTERGRLRVIAVLKGLIGRLEEKKMDFVTSGKPQVNFDGLDLHPRISDAARDLFLDGHHWDAVFAASKALINFVKDRSGRDDLDGANLMRTVFSRNAPILAFNDLSNPTELDEQEGLMHLLEGAVLAIRNQGGHSFPAGSEQRANESLILLSFLAKRVAEGKRPRKGGLE